MFLSMRMPLFSCELKIIFIFIFNPYAVKFESVCRFCNQAIKRFTKFYMNCITRSFKFSRCVESQFNSLFGIHFLRDVPDRGVVKLNICVCPIFTTRFGRFNKASDQPIPHDDFERRVEGSISWQQPAAAKNNSCDGLHRHRRGNHLCDRKKENALYIPLSRLVTPIAIGSRIKNHYDGTSEDPFGLLKFVEVYHINFKKAMKIIDMMKYVQFYQRDTDSPNRAPVEAMPVTCPNLNASPKLPSRTERFKTIVPIPKIMRGNRHAFLQQLIQNSVLENQFTMNEKISLEHFIDGMFCELFPNPPLLNRGREKQNRAAHMALREPPPNEHKWERAFRAFVEAPDYIIINDKEENVVCDRAERVQNATNNTPATTTINLRDCYVELVSSIEKCTREYCLPTQLIVGVRASRKLWLSLENFMHAASGTSDDVLFRLCSQMHDRMRFENHMCMISSWGTTHE